MLDDLLSDKAFKSENSHNALKKGLEQRISWCERNLDEADIYNAKGKVWGWAPSELVMLRKLVREYVLAMNKMPEVLNSPCAQLFREALEESGFHLDGHVRKSAPASAKEHRKFPH